MRPAVFLDRDGTIIEDVHYIADPADVRLIPGAAEALRVLRDAGLVCVIVSNQSAVGRGLATAASMHAVQREVDRQLAGHGAAIDGFYFCTKPPRSPDRSAVDHPERKPGPGMLHRAAADLGLALDQSWMVGDLISDLLAGRNAGCRGTVLVRTGHGAAASPATLAAADHVADDLFAAAAHILAHHHAEPAAGAQRA